MHTLAGIWLVAAGARQEQDHQSQANDDKARSAEGDDDWGGEARAREGAREWGSPEDPERSRPKETK